MEFIRTVCSLVLFCLILRIACSTPEFLGGYLTYSLEDRDNVIYAHIELTTGWALGTGPCGPGCSHLDIGTNTSQSRAAITLREGPTFFGKMTSDYTNFGITMIRDLNNFVHSSFHENVIAVSMAGKWEQEKAILTFPLLQNKTHEDFNFDGVYWRNLSFQGSKRRWHLQARIQSPIRSDTNSRNHCPRVMAKPLYRIKLNTTSTILIPIMDRDGDLVRCSKTVHIAAGEFTFYTLPGVTVHENCTVEIAALSRYGYINNDSLAVLVTVYDFPRTDVLFGDQLYQRAMDPFSATKIDSFAVIRNDNEAYDISQAKADPDGREHIKFAELKWTPSDSDVGSHLACITATDLNGHDSEEIRCFIINVNGERFNSSAQISNKPYFVHVPSTSEFVKCPIEATCVIPIFVKSNSIVRQIHVRNAYVHIANIGLVSEVVVNGDVLYKADLSFQHSKHEQVQICLQAEDVNRCATDVCNPNPCGDHGFCFPSTRPYYCFCSDDMEHFNDYSGVNCEIRSYIYIETSAPRIKNDTAWLVSPVVRDRLNYTQCLRFWYNMNGASIGTLNVYLQAVDGTDIPGKRIWSLAGNQGPDWQFAQVTVISDFDFKIVIEGTVGDGYVGDIAIDDIYFAGGSCDLTTPVTTTSATTALSTSSNGRKCFSCTHLGMSEKCNSFTTCHSGCAIETYVDGYPRYNTGCRNISDKNITRTCLNYCYSDFCNHQGCGVPGHGLRSDRGPLCLDCDDMENMALCKSITPCAKDEVCIIYGSPFTHYDGKCVSKNFQCQGGTSAGGICQSCCDQDMCNTNCTRPAVVSIVG
ncbi:uncharacterized protein LOC128208511 [Mya arenaria]|uniref:uncharacterized protein LOC128208511 n=1 Tax=Mya arenaria TaxID=6604 RepID=UPI0022E18E26|nr:uncharacterized protein LOC128208511 [Mya arenaria]